MARKAQLGLFQRIMTNGEFRVLLKHAIFTAFSSACGLILRYLLLSYKGAHTLSLIGHRFTVTITESAAYAVYYVTGIIVLYLLKWFHARGVRIQSFIPRFMAFSLLYLTSLVIGNKLLVLFTSWGANAELAFWLTGPFTFAINYLGNRLIIFCDVENRQVRRFSKLRRKRGAAYAGKESAKPDDSAE